LQNSICLKKCHLYIHTEHQTINVCMHQHTRWTLLLSGRRHEDWIDRWLWIFSLPHINCFTVLMILLIKYIDNAGVHEDHIVLTCVCVCCVAVLIHCRGLVSKSCRSASGRWTSICMHLRYLFPCLYRIVVNAALANCTEGTTRLSKLKRYVKLPQCLSFMLWYHNREKNV
jgi:hypothetical protein